MTTATTDQVTEIRKNATEVIRIERGEYQGTDLLHARIWYDDGGGDYKPSRKGLSLRPETWREILPPIQEALGPEATGDGQDE